jgi:hypothetical protein
MICDVHGVEGCQSEGCRIWLRLAPDSDASLPRRVEILEMQMKDINTILIQKLYINKDNGSVIYDYGSGV